MYGRLVESGKKKRNQLSEADYAYNDFKRFHYRGG